jgi:phage repressor protein C with HTH and peptisase S24 domain
VQASDFAELCGIPDTSLRNYLSGKSMPGGENLSRIAAATGVSVDWILTGEGLKYRSGNLTFAQPDKKRDEVELVTDIVMVPFYEIEASAGDGCYVDESTAPLFFPLSKSWLEDYIGVSLKDLSLITVTGDSMEPTLSDGDLVIVDTSARYLDQIVEGIYVLRIDGYLRVKRLERRKQKMRVMSDNPNYSPETYDLITFPDEFVVLGRVRGSLKRMD